MVHVEVAPDVTEVGAHCSPETVGSTLTLPPVPVKLTKLPSDAVPIRLLSGSASKLLPLAGDRLAVTTATTPLVIALALEPLARQVRTPAAEPQLSVLPAAVSAGPAAALSPMTSAGE
jgi:hypothetical protein